jgi:AcrR family transcriptional regulator
LQNTLLDAAEAVVVRQGIANLTLDAVAAEAGMSKGGLLHHFPTKDRLVEALVTRSAGNWRACYMEAYERTPEGPGRMARALLDHCFSDAQGFVAAAIDGLWLYWVLGLATVDQELVVRVRIALEDMLARSMPSMPARLSPKAKVRAAKGSGGHCS